MWGPVRAYLIDVPGATATITNDETISTIPINLIDFWIHKQPWQIICIKDSSDNEQEYFAYSKPQQGNGSGSEIIREVREIYTNAQWSDKYQWKFKRETKS